MNNIIKIVSISQTLTAPTQFVVVYSDCKGKLHNKLVGTFLSAEIVNFLERIKNYVTGHDISIYDSREYAEEHPELLDKIKDTIDQILIEEE